MSERITKKRCLGAIKLHCLMKSDNIYNLARVYFLRAKHSRTYMGPPLLKYSVLHVYYAFITSFSCNHISKMLLYRSLNMSETR